MHFLTATSLLLMLTFLSGIAAAEEQLTRKQYIEMFRDDLLAPCHETSFVSCLESTEAQCVKQVNKLIEKCGQKLPDIINKNNFNTSVDHYANCVFGGLQQQFDKSSEEIGQCETRAGLK